MDKREKELALYRMKESEEAFRSGSSLLQIGDFRGAINRFYYATFYAVGGLLIAKGKDARSHSGLLYLFREEFIRNGPLEEETNQLLSRLFDERIESDYAPLSDPGRQEAEQARTDCETFLARARKIFREYAAD